MQLVWADASARVVLSSGTKERDSPSAVEGSLPAIDPCPYKGPLVDGGGVEKPKNRPPKFLSSPQNASIPPKPNFLIQIESPNPFRSTPSKLIE